MNHVNRNCEYKYKVGHLAFKWYITILVHLDNIRRVGFALSNDQNSMIICQTPTGVEFA